MLSLDLSLQNSHYNRPQFYYQQLSHFPFSISSIVEVGEPVLIKRDNKKTPFSAFSIREEPLFEWEVLEFLAVVVYKGVFKVM